jgi:hypothetical protein
MTNPRGTFEQRQMPGLGVPGPPLHWMAAAGGEAGLTEATSNDGAPDAWP